MPCCSSRRIAAVTLKLRHAAFPAATLPTPTAPDEIPLRYVGAHELVLRGAFSERIYRVGPNRRRVSADPADVDTLLRSGLFRHY